MFQLFHGRETLLMVTGVFYAMVRALLQVRIADDVRKIASSDKWRTEYMTNQLFYIEARKEGREEGREEGIDQIITTLLLKGKTPEEIHDLCDIPFERVVEIRKSHELSQTVS